VTLDQKRWLVRAQQLKFSQLDVARARADTWRTGLATLTTLLTGILVVKGKDDVSTLTTPFQVLAAILLGVALVLLLWATLWLSRALAGPPGEEFLLTGEQLEQWTQGEVRKIERVLFWAPGMAAASVLIVAAATAVTWFAPTQPATQGELVQVTESTGEQHCGQLAGTARHDLILTAPAALVPLSAVTAITPVATCP
jgi:hypothetical protein